MFYAPQGGDGPYAVVSYIPDPLAGFLNRLRQELVPDCFLRAHITVLPPRCVKPPIEEAWAEFREAAGGFQPFTIELTHVEVFQVSDVIYVAAGTGRDQLEHMHQALNHGHMEYQEPFHYHPHVTLAQNLTSDQVDELSVVARQRWAEYTGDRTFRVEALTFVQNMGGNRWLDLAAVELGRETVLA